jgi:hypothetical protein
VSCDRAYVDGPGADAGTRTRNRPITSRVRYQLRHVGTVPTDLTPTQPVDRYRLTTSPSVPPSSGFVAFAVGWAGAVGVRVGRRLWGGGGGLAMGASDVYRVEL